MRTRRHYGQWCERDDDRLKRMWPNKDLSIGVIAERLGYGETKVREQAKRLGLPLRGTFRGKSQKAA